MDDDAPAFEYDAPERELTPTLNERILDVYERVGDRIDLNFEQFQRLILRSKSPDDEAVIWAGVAAVWEDYRRKYLTGKPIEIEQERRIVAALTAIAGGEQELSKLPVSFDVATSLLSCYVDVADELPFSKP